MVEALVPLEIHQAPTQVKEIKVVTTEAVTVAAEVAQLETELMVQLQLVVQVLHLQSLGHL
jgi:hypothetical protein